MTISRGFALVLGPWWVLGSWQVAAVEGRAAREEVETGAETLLQRRLSRASARPVSPQAPLETTLAAAPT